MTQVEQTIQITTAMRITQYRISSKRYLISRLIRLCLDLIHSISQQQARMMIVKSLRTSHFMIVL
jgi:hypothetical protein